MDSISFTGKNAFVTGASRGIGKAIALSLARAGAGVAVAATSAEGAERTAAEAAELGATARAYACDVASFDQVKAVGDSVMADLGSIDFVVNNAGIVRDKLMLRMTPEDWERVLSVNLTGAYNCVKVFSPHLLKQRRGKIVNITSVIGLMGNAGQANYAASKAGIIGFTRSLAREFAPRGITVNAVAPGYITTEMTEGLSDDARKKMLDIIPLGRLGNVMDVANVVLFLLSDMADYVTGQVINCDGGMLMA